MLILQSVFFAPNTELIQHGHQRLSTLRQGILNLRRDLRILGADDQFIRFQLLEIRAESFVGNGFQIPFQLIESHRLKLHQAVKNDHLVLAGDQRQCHERRMGHHAGAGLRCSEPHRDTQDRTEHQGTGSIHRQHCRCSPHSGSRLFRRRVRQ